MKAYRTKFSIGLVALLAVIFSFAPAAPQTAEAVVTSKIVINEFYRSGNLEGSDEWVELLLLEDMTSTELETYFVGDSTSSTESKFSFLEFTGLNAIATTFEAGTIIVVSGDVPDDEFTYTEDTTYNPAGDDWSIILFSGGDFMNDPVGEATDLAGTDVVWVDTVNTGDTISADGFAVNYDSTPGTLGGNATVTVPAPASTTGVVLNAGGDVADVTGNWQSSISAANLTPGEPNGGDNTTFIQNLRDGGGTATGIDLTTNITGPAEVATEVKVTYSVTATNIGDTASGTAQIGFGVVDELDMPLTVSDVLYEVSATECTVATIPAYGVACTVTSISPDAPTLRVPFTFDVDVTFTSDGSFTVGSLAVTSDDTDADNDDFSLPIVVTPPADCSTPPDFIYELQENGGKHNPDGDDMPSNPRTVVGIVTGDFQLDSPNGLNGFYMQDPTGDADASTSDGIFVFEDDGAFILDVNQNDRVIVTGVTYERFGQTVLEPTAVASCGDTGTITPTTVQLPIASLDDYENFEGMLITVEAADTNPLTATDTFNLGRFGETFVSSGGRLFNPTNYIAPGAAAVTQSELNQRRQLLIDDGRDGNPGENEVPFIPTTEDVFRNGFTTPSITGVLGFGFGDFRLQPTETINWTAANPRPASPEGLTGDVLVASINVQNYFNGDGIGAGFPTARGADSAAELTRQTDKLVAAIIGTGADIIGLSEIENDAVDGNSAIEALVVALNAEAGAGTYDFIDTGVIGTDVIRVGIIYKPGVVTPTGDVQVLDTQAFVDPNNTGLGRNRPAVAQAFTYPPSDASFIVVVNHFKSKGDSGLDETDACMNNPETDLDCDQGDGQGFWNDTRTKAATALVNWLDTNPTGTGITNYLILGDLNAYAAEDPVTEFKNQGFTNLIEDYVGDGETAYSYAFFGEFGTLDYALANPGMAELVVSATEWHINSDEPKNRDYNDDIDDGPEPSSELNPAYLYQDNAFRSSDHDPIVVGLNLQGPSDFTLLSPANNALVRDVAAVTEITWSDPTDADEFTFSLFKLSNNIGIRLNPGDSVEVTGTAVSDDDDITCADSVCTLTVDLTATGLNLSDGLYGWTTVASNSIGNTEASNAPYFFEVNSGTITIITSDFEESEDVDMDGVPDQFTPLGRFAGDKIRCNVTDRPNDKPDKIFANTGECAFQFKKNEPGRSRLRFEFDPTEYSLAVGDTISVSIALDAKNFDDSRTFGKVRVRFDETLDDGTRAKIVERLRTVNTADGYEVVTLDITLDRDDFFGDVRIDLSDVTGPGNRILIDTFSVVVSSSAPTIIDPAAPLALPDAPDGMRGGN